MLVLFAVVTVLLIAGMAVAIDGSFSFVQVRRAQNAADLASLAGARQLQGTLACSGAGSVPNMQQIVNVVQDLVNSNSGAVGQAWTANFLDALGRPISNGGFSPGSASTGSYPPPGACGVSVVAKPSWTTFLSGVFGLPQITAATVASAGPKFQSNPISIVALNKNMDHIITGGGAGKFILSGDVALNSDGSYRKDWLKANPMNSAYGLLWDDVIDAKKNSSVYVYGTIHAVKATQQGQALWPLDWCFNGTPPVNANGTVLYTQDGPPPANQPPCSTEPVAVAYNHIDPTFAPIDDPLQGAGAPPSPFSLGPSCPGISAQAQIHSSIAPGTTTLEPGEYTSPVHITTSIRFEDCSAYSNEPDYPGVYLFDQGLWIDLQQSVASVTGSNVVIATKNPYPLPGNVPGSGFGGAFTPSGLGNGGPCLPAGTTAANGKVDADGSPASACGGTSDYGVYSWDSNTYIHTIYGTGTNFSLMIGGVSGSSVSLTGPTTGPYGGGGGGPGLALYQDVATQTNFGFNATTGAAADVTVTGVVYNASLSNYGVGSAGLWYDDSLPLYAGGTLQAGYGTGWTGGPPASAGSITITGTCVVDQFDTGGGTGITIIGKPYPVPTGGDVSLVG